MIKIIVMLILKRTVQGFTTQVLETIHMDALLPLGSKILLNRFSLMSHPDLLSSGQRRRLVVIEYSYDVDDKAITMYVEPEIVKELSSAHATVGE